MVRASALSICERRSALIDAMRGEQRTLEELFARFAGQVSQRTVKKDLAWLRREKVVGFEQRRIRAGRSGPRMEYTFVGEPPDLIQRPLTYLHHLELIAMIAARGLFRQPDHKPGLERPDAGYTGALSAAFDQLLHRCGLAGRANRLVPDSITASRFAVASEDSGIFLETLRAVIAGNGLRIDYRNRRGKSKLVHIAPLRLVLIRGEWHCFAWEGRLKQYRISRIAKAECTRSRPSGTPTAFLRQGIDDVLRLGFGATGSNRGEDLTRVVLAVGPKALPLIEGRTWGEKQSWTGWTKDLPRGWKRLGFNTTGLEEARHWVLGMGTAVRAEHPPRLLSWLRKQAQGIVAKLPTTRIRVPRALGAAQSSLRQDTIPTHLEAT